MHPAASEAPVVLVGNKFDPPRECIDHYQDVGVALVIDWKRTDVVYV